MPFFRCSKILGETGKQEILQQMFRKFQISNRLPNRYFRKIDVGCPWLIYLQFTQTKSIHAKRRRQRERQKKAIGLISRKKRDNFARAAHFFVHFFAVVLHDYVLTCTFYSFYGGNSVFADLFLTCSRLFLSLLLFSFSFFFSLPLIITLVAAYFLTAPRENCHVLLPTKYMIPLRFLSLALALSSVINVNVDIKTYLVEGKTRICCCCCFFPLKVRWSCDLPLKREGA